MSDIAISILALKLIKNVSSSSSHKKTLKLWNSETPEF